MAKITFIILAHENANHTAELARTLTEWDENAHAVIHYDLKSPVHEFEKLKGQFAAGSRVHFVTDRIRCGWGDFSLVDATVRALKLIRKDKIDCERVMLVSGACMPIRPLKELSQFLDAHPKSEFIETFDSSWIVGGLRNERWQYWHFFNFQTQYPLFHHHYHIQRKIWPKRKFPRGLEPSYGSQWWCLSWGVCEKILNYISKHPLVYFFFSTTWIPDEMFFQTMAHKFTSEAHLARRNLTFVQFNEWGKPLIFLNDHFDLLQQVPYFFARKISARATDLRARLRALAVGPARKDAQKFDFRAPYKFPYKEALAALPKADIATPALFQYRKKDGWALALDQCEKSFAILYGPPQLTKRAADAIRGEKDLTVLGRLFKRDNMDIGNERHDLGGLRPIDNKIRDMDTPLYFQRILSRCDSLPVFELCPGDDPISELALLESQNAIVMPVVPGRSDEAMQQIYWILCAAETGARLEKSEAGASASTFRSMLDAVDGTVLQDHRDKIATCIKNATAAHQASFDYWRAALEFQHGPVALPLADAYEKMNDAVASTTPMQIARSAPAKWADSIAALARLDPDWQILRCSAPITSQAFWTTAAQLKLLSPLVSRSASSAAKKT